MRLRRARLSFPKWVATALEKEFGLNDPMSVLLTVCLFSKSWPHGGLMVAHAAILFYEETGGVASLLRWLPSAAHNDFAALWLAYMLLCRRFADVLADACARLGADVGRYSFIFVEFHHILLAVSRRTHLRYGPLACSTAPRPPLSRRFDPASHPAKSLVSYQGYRQFPAWNLPPLVMQALGAHGLL